MKKKLFCLIILFVGKTNSPIVKATWMYNYEFMKISGVPKGVYLLYSGNTDCVVIVVRFSETDEMAELTSKIWLFQLLKSFLLLQVSLPSK